MKYGKFIEAVRSDADQLVFLARAVLKIPDEKTRYTAALQYIYLEKSEKEGCLIGAATDRRRLHVTEICADLVEGLGLFAGYWRVLKSKNSKRIIWLTNVEDTENILFPDFKKVIPSGEAKYKTTFEGLDFSNYGSYHTKLAMFLHDLPDVTAINLNYIHNLGGGSWEVSWYGQNKAIKFTNGDRICVIMPLQID